MQERAHAINIRNAGVNHFSLQLLAAIWRRASAIIWQQLSSRDSQLSSIAGFRPIVKEGQAVIGEHRQLGFRDLHLAVKSEGLGFGACQSRFSARYIPMCIRSLPNRPKQGLGSIGGRTHWSN